ncbi:Ig-like domain-containing protein [Pseudoxanthobacter sp. M-2]|uniref:integrin alpha n=1 Tax=Pseudoxanthobacter sp. M-2 TaxID=3078754 RepID=UPI0038FCC7F0
MRKPTLVALAILCVQTLSVVPDTARAASSTVTIELDPKSNTGLRPKSGWTNLDKPSVLGKAPAGAMVEVVNGKNVLCRTKASKSGAWTCKIGPLADRFYTLYALSGKLVSKPVRVLVDTKPPKPPTFYPSYPRGFTSADGKSKVYIADSGRLSLDGVASECGEVILTRGRRTIGRVDSNCGSWGKEVDLASGLHDFSAVLVDAAGNRSRAVGVTLFVEASLPRTQLAEIGGNTGVQFFSSSSPKGAQLSIASAGDVNGDGRSDVVMGESAFILQVSGSWKAKAHLVFGSSKLPKSPVDVDTLKEGQAVELLTPGRPFNMGLSVSGAGDVNGDGFDDLLIGWPTGSPLGREDAGVAYVVFGGGNLPRTLHLETLDGANGFRIAGPWAGSRLGGTVIGAGDVNGDGLGDIAVVTARPNEKPARPHNGVTIVFGRDTGFPPVLDLAHFRAEDGFDVTGFFGSADVSPTLAAGDFNGDGFSDVAAGYRFTGEGRGDLYEAAGRILVVFGGPTGKLKSGSVDRPADAIDALTIDGRFGHPDPRANLGASLAAGDFNGDGVDDLAACGQACANAFILYGGRTFRKGSMKIDELKNKDGFAYANLLGYARMAMNSAGDVNADGRDDVLISDFESEGVVQLAFGQRKMKLPVWPITPAFDDEGRMFSGANGDAAGTTLSPAGDFNDDGVEDFMVSTSYVYPRKRTPRAIVVFGVRQEK